MGFDEFMQGLAEDLGSETPTTPSISHEGQIARARELAERVAVGNPFEVGDLVTPRIDAPVHFAGDPHVVVAVRADAYRPEFPQLTAWDFRVSDPGDPSFGGVFDLRVAHVQNDHVVLHWVESCYFEAYDPAVHDKKAADR